MTQGCVQPEASPALLCSAYHPTEGGVLFLSQHRILPGHFLEFKTKGCLCARCPAGQHQVWALVSEACGVTAEPGPSSPFLALRSVVPFALVQLSGAHCLPVVSLSRTRVLGGQRDAHPHFHFAKAQPRAAVLRGAEDGPALPDPQHASLSSQQATCKTRPRPPSRRLPTASPAQQHRALGVQAGPHLSPEAPAHVQLSPASTCFLRPLSAFAREPRRALIIGQLPPGTCPIPGTHVGAGGSGMEEMVPAA